MAITLNIQDNKKFKNVSMTLNKDTQESITITGDIADQVEYYENKGNIEIKAYSLLSIRYIKEVYKSTKNGSIVTYYLYDPETKKYTKTGTVNKPGDLSDSGTYYCKVWATIKGIEATRTYELTNPCIEYTTTDFRERNDSYFNDNGKTLYNDKQYIDWQNPLGTITLKNSGKEGIANVAKVSYKTDGNGTVTNLLTQRYTIGEGDGFVGKVNQTGTYLNENIEGGYKNDTLKGVGGSNKLIGNEGDDKLYSGKGADTFYFTTGDADSSTGDIIYSADNLDTIEFHSLNNSGKENFDMSKIEMYKQNNNLIIIAPSKDSDGDNTREKVTVNNFYKTKDENKIRNIRITGTNAKTGTIDKDGNLTYDSTTISVKELISGKGTLKGSDTDNTFTPSGKSTMITGGGNDTIYLSSYTDTINITGSGTKTIKYEAFSGDSQIINIKNKDAIVNFYIDDTINPTPKGFYRYKDDLIIEWKNKTKSWTYEGCIKDYYNSEKVNKSNIKINNTVVSISNLIYLGTNGKDTMDLNKTTNYTVYPSLGNDKIIINGGSGKKTLRFSWGCGNNTVEFKGEKQTGKVDIEIMYSDAYDYNFIKDGNDLLLRLGMINAKGVFITKNIETFKDFFTSTLLPDEENINVVESYYYSYEDPETTVLSTYLNNHGLNVNGVYNKNEKRMEYTGTNYNDIFSGNKNPKYITTGNGNDKVYLGKGDDTVIVNGTGAKTVYINKNEGIDTIDMQNNTATVNLVYGNNYRFSYSNEDGNRILKRIYDNGKKFVTEKTIIKNYKDGKLKINGVVKNNANTPVLVEGDFNNPNSYTVQSGENKLVTLGKKADTFVSNGNNAEVFAGAGDDKIAINTGTAFIDAGKGNDEIIINSNSAVNFYFAAGDGNDTIRFGKVPTTPADTYFDIDFKGIFGNTYGPMVNAVKTGKMKFTKSGDDLIFTKLATKSKTETITIEDYFKAGNENLKDMTIHSTDLQKFGFDDETLQQTINYNYNFYYAEYIFGTSDIFGLNIEGEVNGYNTTIFKGVAGYNNIYTYTGKGKAEMRSVAGTNKDLYQTTINAKRELTIKDVGGNKDELILNNGKGTLNLFFNVTKDRKIVRDELYIFNKSSLTYGNMAAFYGGRNTTGYVEIDDYFTSGTGYSSFTKGDGYIEDIKLAKNKYVYSNKYIDMSSWINRVGEAVAAWLDNHSEYASTEAVLNGGNKKDITSLLKVYQGISASKFV